MCGQKRYFGDDRTDEYLKKKWQREERRKPRGETGDGRPFPWSFQRLAHDLTRRLRPA